MRLFAAFFALNSALLCVDAVDSSTAKAFIRYKTVPDIIVTPPQYPIYARFPGGSQVRLGNSLSPGKVRIWHVRKSFRFYTFAYGFGVN